MTVLVCGQRVRFTADIDGWEAHAAHLTPPLIKAGDVGEYVRPADGLPDAHVCSVRRGDALLAVVADDGGFVAA